LRYIGRVHIHRRIVCRSYALSVTVGELATPMTDDNRDILHVILEVGRVPRPSVPDIPAWTRRSVQLDFHCFESKCLSRRPAATINDGCNQRYLVRLFRFLLLHAAPAGGRERAPAPRQQVARISGPVRS
jgi:hypothetical protein